MRGKNYFRTYMFDKVKISAHQKRESDVVALDNQPKPHNSISQLCL